MWIFLGGREAFFGIQPDCMSRQSIASASGWWTWSFSSCTSRVARITCTQSSADRSTCDRESSLWLDPSPQ